MVARELDVMETSSLRLSGLFIGAKRIESISLVRGACEESMLEDPLDSSNSLNDEILSGDGSSLVEAADVDTTGERDPEGFGTEDG